MSMPEYHRCGMGPVAVIPKWVSLAGMMAKRGWVYTTNLLF